MAEKRTNLGASIRAQLLNQARASGQPFDLILVRFALERLLYRLSISGHAERFVLKGAMLLTTWFDDPARPTRDLDLLGFGDPDPDAMQATFRDILSIEVDDGILFNPDTLRVDRIREALDYGGVRLRAVADVGGARVPIACGSAFKWDPALTEAIALITILKLAHAGVPNGAYRDPGQNRIITSIQDNRSFRTRARLQRRSTRTRGQYAKYPARNEELCTGAALAAPVAVDFTSRRASRSVRQRAG